jgi:hypothetical protein
MLIFDVKIEDEKDNFSKDEEYEDLEKDEEKFEDTVN